MWSQRKGGLSAITKVKVFNPEITILAQGQGFHFLKAGIVACVKGEYVRGPQTQYLCVWEPSGVPGSESVAGNRTVHIGTWESRIVPDRSVHHSIVSLHRGIAALHGGLVL